MATIWESFCTLQADMLCPLTRKGKVKTRKTFTEIFNDVLQKKRLFLLGDVFLNATIADKGNRFFLLKMIEFFHLMHQQHDDFPADL